MTSAKGRVERAVGYVKKNFLGGRQATGLDALNPAVLHWLDTVANARLHPATKRRPADLFAQEKARLRPLPDRPYDVSVVRETRADRCCRVTLDTNRYSVPHRYASRPLRLKITLRRLCIYHQEDLVAAHPRSYGRDQEQVDPGHLKPLLEQRQKARWQNIYRRFLGLCPQAGTYYQGLEDRRLDPRNHVRKIVALSEIYGPEKAARALADALELEAFSSEYITNILEQRGRFKAQQGALHLTRREDLLQMELPGADLSPYLGGGEGGADES